MINSDIQHAINEQINQELTAGYSYLGMCAWFEDRNLPGFAHWCRLQYEEETAHAMRLFQYLLDRGGRVNLETVHGPREDYESVLEVFRAALGMEQENTASIDQLYSLAQQHNDHATMSHLQWFVDEQVEEEKNVGDVVARIEMAQDDQSAMLFLDDKLSQRAPEAGADTAS